MWLSAAASTRSVSSAGSIPGPGTWTKLKSPPVSATLTPYFFAMAMRITVSTVEVSPPTAIFLPLRSSMVLIGLSFLTQMPKPAGAAL